MKPIPEPLPGSFAAAELFQLRMALRSTYAQRLQDLQDMLDFNAEAEAKNPRLRWAAERLRPITRTATSLADQASNEKGLWYAAD